jgi:uncharacterized protein YoxC
VQAARRSCDLDTQSLRAEAKDAIKRVLAEVVARDRTVEKILSQMAGTDSRLDAILKSVTVMHDDQAIAKKGLETLGHSLGDVKRALEKVQQQATEMYQTVRSIGHDLSEIDGRLAELEIAPTPSPSAQQQASVPAQPAVVMPPLHPVIATLVDNLKSLFIQVEATSGTLSRVANSLVSKDLALKMEQATISGTTPAQASGSSAAKSPRPRKRPSLDADEGTAADSV